MYKESQFLRRANSQLFLNFSAWEIELSTFRSMNYLIVKQIIMSDKNVNVRRDTGLSICENAKRWQTRLVSFGPSSTGGLTLFDLDRFANIGSGLMTWHRFLSDLARLAWLETQCCLIIVKWKVPDIETKRTAVRYPLVTRVVCATFTPASSLKVLVVRSFSLASTARFVRRVYDHGVWKINLQNNVTRCRYWFIVT